MGQFIDDLRFIPFLQFDFNDHTKVNPGLSSAMIVAELPVGETN